MTEQYQKKGINLEQSLLVQSDGVELSDDVSVLNFIGGGASLPSPGVVNAILGNTGWDPAATYWVDAGYTGGDSDGTPSKPFTTIQEAIDLAWDEVSSQAFEAYSTVIVAPGVYSEVELVFYPFVTVVGLDADSTRITSANPIRLFSFGYYNLHNLRFESAWDCTMTSGPYFGWYVWMRSWNCRFDAAVTFSGLGADWHWLEFHDAYFNGGAAIDVTNVNWWLNDSVVYSTTLTAASSAAGTHTFTGKDGRRYATGVYFYDSFVAGDLSTSEISGANGVWTEFACRYFGAATIDGANSTAETTGFGYPEDGLTLSSGAAQFAGGDARGEKYTPTTPGDWAATPPDTVGEAIDRLAAANPGA
jgi:hypothetical protein